MARLSASPHPSYPSYSLSPSPSFSTPSFVERAVDDDTSSDEEDHLNILGRSPGPVHSDDERVDGGGGGERDRNNGEAPGAGEEETVVCLWEDCGKLFTRLPTLIDHIHSDHIGVHKSNYTCEWSTCTRRGLAQTSRFALISHIRSHTGEKPFTCPRPECDKSFTRSDALAKHMRLQHNISPPLPGRGGNRKRKRSDATSHPPDMGVVDPSAPSAFTTFKVESAAQTPFDLQQPYEETYVEAGNGGGDYFSQPPPPPPPPHPNPPPAQTRQRSRSPSDDEEIIPPQLLQALDPQSGLILGRTPSMVRYLITKAKHRFVIEQHECLIEELRVLRAEEKRERAEKDILMDRVLRASFGPAADEFVAYSSGPSNSNRHRTTHSRDGFYTER